MEIIKKHNSKFEHYNITQRLEDLKNCVEIQCIKGNYDCNDYMRGMANGLLLAWYIMQEPYGAEVPFFGPEFTSNKTASKTELKELKETLK